MKLFGLNIVNERLYKLFAGFLLISSILIAQEILKISEYAPIFSSPDENTRVIAFANAGEEAQVLGYENNFYFVRYSSFGKEYNGYIHQSKVVLTIKKRADLKKLNPFEKQPSVKIPRSLAKGATVIRANQGEKKKNYFTKKILREVLQNFLFNFFFIKKKTF